MILDLRVAEIRHCLFEHADDGEGNSLISNVWLHGRVIAAEPLFRKPPPSDWVSTSCGRLSTRKRFSPMRNTIGWRTKALVTGGSH